MFEIVSTFCSISNSFRATSLFRWVESPPLGSQIFQAEQTRCHLTKFSSLYTNRYTFCQGMCSAPEKLINRGLLDVSGRFRLKIKIEHLWWLYKKLIFFRLHQEKNKIPTKWVSILCTSFSNPGGGGRKYMTF